jgi:hypothetical protein
VRALVLASAVFLVAAAPAAAGSPPLRVSKTKLRAAFHCEGKIEDARRTPLMVVTGTGITGDQAYAIGKPALDAFGHPACWVNFPDFTTADIQVSVEYLVYGLRREFRLAGRKVAVFGISQGGLLPRFALTYWPGLRHKVSDVLAAAGTQHGTIAGLGTCSMMDPCAPASWQQGHGSKLLRALNGQPDETPGRVSYTTVRSLTDRTVRPQGGTHPTSALRGARNILIQDVCPGRRTSHIGTAVDSVTLAAIMNAIGRRGPGKRGAAKVSELGAGVCSHPYGTGLDEATTDALVNGASGLIDSQEETVPKVPREPRVRRVFR